MTAPTVLSVDWNHRLHLLSISQPAWKHLLKFTGGVYLSSRSYWKGQYVRDEKIIPGYKFSGQEPANNSGLLLLEMWVNLEAGFLVPFDLGRAVAPRQFDNHLLRDPEPEPSRKATWGSWLSETVK